MGVKQVLAMLSLMVLLAACGGTSATSATAPTPPTAPPTAAGPTVAAPTAPRASAVAPTTASPPTATLAAQAAPPPTATPVATQESPAGQKLGAGVKSAADVDALDLDGKTVEISFWHIFTANQEAGLKDIIAQFETRYPNIKVRASYKGMYDTTRKAILTSIAGNSVPDMVWSFPYSVSEYAREDAVQPLDPFMRSAKYGLGVPPTGTDKALAEQLPPAVLKAYQYPDFDNQTLSLPPAVSVEVMFYNADWLKQLGYDKPPATWDDFMAVCAKVKATTPDKACTALLPSGNAFAAQVFSRGGELLTPDRQQAAYRDPGLATLKWYKELFDKGYAYQPAQQFADQTDFGLGKVLFTFGTSTSVPFYRRVVTDAATAKERFAWSFTGYPQSTGQTAYNVFGPSAAILKTTPERSLAAWLFLKYWLSAEPSATWGIQSNYYPLNRAAVDTAAMKKYLADNPVYARGFDLFQFARSEPSTPGWQGARSGIVDGVTAVITGKASPEQAIESMIKSTNEALK